MKKKAEEETQTKKYDKGRILFEEQMKYKSSSVKGINK